MLLAPYFQIGTKPTDQINDYLNKARTYEDIITASSSFMDFAASLHWLDFQLKGTPLPPEVFLEPTHGPIRRILPHTGQIPDTHELQPHS